MSDPAPERLRALWQSQLTSADEPSLHVPSASDDVAESFSDLEALEAVVQCGSEEITGTSGSQVLG